MSTAPREGSPRFAVALSTAADPRAAVDEVCTAAREQLGAAPDLAFAFVSPHYAEAFDSLGAEIRQRTGARCLLGASGESIVAGGREIEQSRALVLWLAHLPKVVLEPVRLAFEQTPDGGSIVGWPDALADSWPAGASLLALAEPFSFPADLLLERLNEDRPGVPVVGGMASGGLGPGENRIWLNDDAFRDGAVAVLVHGAIALQAVVSQGCRPIGRPFVITKAERNLIHELSGEPALRRFQEVVETLSEAEQQLLRHGLHVGRVTNEYQESFSQGDFLVRNVIGADREQGAIALGDYVRPGQTVQFHVRDAQTADEELRELMTRDRQAHSAAASAALLFTCNGRGTRLFDGPDHDASVLREVIGEAPLAGFFAQGEMGPVGGRNFLHGFTASVALFRPV